MAFNSILMALNIMMYGMSFDIEGPGFLMKTILFMIVTLSCAVVEILTVKLMQRHDDRLKGDPTSFGFHRDFLASCDEAEKLKIYESGYKAFQFSKNGAMFVVIFTVLLKITDFSGSFPIFISSISFLMILISYNYYAIKADS